MKNAFSNWSDIRCFLAVARAGSTLAAARSLGQSQPTVARRIEALEHTLGVTLFSRDTQGFHLTPAGTMLIAPAEAVEAAAGTFESVAQSSRTSASTIRFTMPPQNLSPGFMQIIDDFRETHPQVTFDFVTSYRTLDLVAGEADVAIRIDPDLLDNRLICRKLTTATSSLYASETYAARNGLPASMEDSAGHRYVLMSRTGRSFPVHTWLVETLEPDRIVARVEDVDALISSARSGIGVVPLPTSLAADHPELIRCFPPPEFSGVPVWLLISPQAWVRPEVKAFASFFAPRWIAHIEAIKATALRAEAP